MLIKNPTILRIRNSDITLLDVIFPTVMILSALRGIFFKKWFAGQMWFMPSDFLLWSSGALVLAIILVLTLPRLDLVLQVSSMFIPFCVWMSMTAIPLPEILHSGALESITEMTLGYMIAIPYSFVFLRNAQVCSSRVASVIAFIFFILFLLWGIAAAVMRDNLF
jgi:hypothetical protein